MKAPWIRTSRRGLVKGLAGLTFGAGITGWLRSSVSRAGGEATNLRLVLLHRPNGTIRSQWLDGTTHGTILEPFDDLRPYMLVPDGLEINPSNGGFSSHEGALVTFMTLAPVGEPRPPSNDDYKNTATSVDVRFGETSAMLGVAPIRSVQLAAHNRQEGGLQETANLTLTYIGEDDAVLPVTTPSLAYAGLVGAVAPGHTPEELQKLRVKRQSVLDFVQDDLARVRQIAPASQAEMFDAHEDAIRTLEQSLDAAACETDGEPPLDPPDTDWFEDVAVAGAQHLSIVRTAFACDLTRLVSFMWSAGASSVTFEELYPGMGTVQHHNRSHGDLAADTVAQSLGAIDRWYSERTAEFLRTLRDTPDFAGGSLLDNTLVVYFSEVAAGSHDFSPMPVVLFGGAGVGLQGDQVLDFAGRSVADLWLAIADRFGADLGTLGIESGGPLPGLFG
jgi:hypothetical protein